MVHQADDQAEWCFNIHPLWLRSCDYKQHLRRDNFVWNGKLGIVGIVDDQISLEQNGLVSDVSQNQQHCCNIYGRSRPEDSLLHKNWSKQLPV